MELGSGSEFVLDSDAIDQDGDEDNQDDENDENNNVKSTLDDDDDDDNDGDDDSDHGANQVKRKSSVFPTAARIKKNAPNLQVPRKGCILVASESEAGSD